MIFKHRMVHRCLVLAIFAHAPWCAAQQLVVGTGARMSLGNTTVDAGCRDVAITGTIDLGAGAIRGARDLAVSGTLNGGSGLIELSGDLAAGANLVPQTGTVRIIDGCGSTESVLTGNHQFNRLRVETTTGRSLVLPASGTQTISSSLELIGGTQRLLIRSSAAPTVGFLSLNPGGTQTISRVDAINVGAPTTGGQYLAPLLPAAYDSVDRGNTPRFFGDAAAIPIPTLSTYSLFTLISLFAGFGLFQSRTFVKGDC